MVDILLIQPPIADFYLTAKRTIPYGLAAIAAAVREKGFSVAILDGLATGKSRVTEPPPEMAYLDAYYGRADRSPFSLFHAFRHYGYSPEHIGTEIKRSGAFLVGIASLFTAYSDMAMAMARIAKSSLPGCRVVLGGHHPTTLPEAVMAEPAVDWVLRGEGEIGLPALAAALKTGEVLDAVPGLVRRKADGSLQVAEPALCNHPDQFPVPAFDLIRRKFYRRAGKDSIAITASRGCPLACSYCATGRRSWMGFRKRSVASVLREIQAAGQGRRVGFIDFEDENLTMDRPWFLELMAGIRDLFGDELPELRAMNGLLPPSLDESVVGAMKASGFKTLNLSLGSSNREQLRRFNRPDVRAAFDRAVTLGRRQGLAAVGYIIVGAPDQDALSSVEDLLFLYRRRVLAGVSVFYPAPGSDDYEKCRKQNLLPGTFAEMRATALPVHQKTSRLETVTLLRLGRILNFMKSLEDEKIPLPKPAAMDHRVASDPDRRAVGMRLLAGFFHDGALRGVDKHGRVYDHKAAQHLCRHLLDGLALRR
jgi:radical SAM superfamily enzyme YgiQ (UPF0313 family)